MSLDTTPCCGTAVKTNTAPTIFVYACSNRNCSRERYAEGYQQQVTKSMKDDYPTGGYGYCWCDCCQSVEPKSTCQTCGEAGNIITILQDSSRS